MLAAVALPADQSVDPSSVSVRVVALGSEDRPLAVSKISVAPAVDVKTLGQTLLIKVETRGLGLRAGEPVTAWLTPSPKPQDGVLVPRDAVVWHEGKAWAYLQAAPDQFVRRQVPTDRPMKDGWFVAAGFSPGQRLIVQGAQQLLSEEFKPVLPAGGGADLD
jgi:multidrug efflux pump subunit AcrA (membrane-fusion protein)